MHLLGVLLLLFTMFVPVDTKSICGQVITAGEGSWHICVDQKENEIYHLFSDPATTATASTKSQPSSISHTPSSSQNHFSPSSQGSFAQWDQIYRPSPTRYDSGTTYSIPTYDSTLHFSGTSQSGGNGQNGFGTESGNGYNSYASQTSGAFSIPDHQKIWSEKIKQMELESNAWTQKIEYWNRNAQYSDENRWKPENPPVYHYDVNSAFRQQNELQAKIAAAQAPIDQMVSLNIGIAIAMVASGFPERVKEIDVQIDFSNDFDKTMEAIDYYSPRKFTDYMTGFERQVKQSAYNGFVNDQGLVKKWAHHEILEKHTFSTKIGTPDGDAIRSELNRAGFAYHGGVRASSSQHTSVANVALELLTNADQHLGTEYDAHARRLIEQAKVITDYASHHERVREYKEIEIDRTTAEELGVRDLQFGPLGTQEILVVNEFSKLRPEQRSDLARLHVQLALRSANEYNAQNNPLAAHKMIGNAFAVVDFAKGASKGLVQNVYDAVSGMWHLVSHPIDSASAIANAIRHYDVIYDLAVQQLQVLVSNYPNMSNQERGRIWGYAAGEILTWMMAGGFSISKEINTITKVSQALAVEIEKAAPIARALTEGAIHLGRTSTRLPDDIALWLAKSEWKLPDEAILKVPEVLGNSILNQDKKGLRWITEKGRYGIRIDRGDLSSDFKVQHVDHVRITFNGKAIDSSGNPVISSTPGMKTANLPEVHIPLSEWLQWRHWYKP